MTIFGTVAAPGLHVMSWNIRRRVPYPNPRKADRWAHRAPRLRAMLQAEQPAVLGVQEALAEQAEFVQGSLGQIYRFVGHGRTSSGRGERNPIFFDAIRLQLLSWEQQALSRTPWAPGSRSWGNLHPRIVVSARFLDRATGARFLVLNTHLDHLSARSRVHSARAIGELVAASQIPVVITGDLNATVDSEPLRVLLSGDRLAETWAAAQHQETCEWNTLANYRRPRLRGSRVDWILVSPSVRVDSAAINDQRYQAGWASDHLPVHAVLRIPGVQH